jgi:hypothetical protein
MRRFLLALLMTTVVASLQAITINWQIANSEYTWDDAGFSSYLVYSESGDLSAEAVYDGKYNGYKVSTGTLEQVSYNTETGTSSATVVGEKDAGYLKTSYYTMGPYANADLKGQAFGDGYFYLVVFQTGTDTTNNPQYAVSQAVHYIPNESNASNGIYDITVDGEAPEMGQYIEIPWLGGTWRDAVVPEPTALALLALGVAGLALRRKI